MATVPGADIRGYYTALAIHLPATATLEASVRCFADPDAHAHGDRNPSCSVNLTTGAFNCHGCGARGGAYDAALAKGHTPRSAIDLMITHGLAQRRQPHNIQRELARTRTARRAPGTPPPRTVDASPPMLVTSDGRTVDERLLSVWQHELHGHRRLIRRLAFERGWRGQDLAELGIGLVGGRLAIPVYHPHGRLDGVLLYQPFARHRKPKTIAIRGSHLGLIPPPAHTPDRELLLCEGPGDMFSARGRGLGAIAVPSATAWRTHWAEQLHAREVTIVMDADPPGRRAAALIARDLADQRVAASAIDLAPDRDDGYDLSDWLTQHRELPLTIPRLRELALGPSEGAARRPQLAVTSADPATPRLANRGAPPLSPRRWVL
jgi:hypothetical protein